MIRLIAVLLFACTSLYAQDDRELLVSLQTDNQFIPIYLAHLAPTQSTFDKGYLDQLEAVLRFDLFQSGSLKIIAVKPEYEELAKQSAAQPSDLIKQWKDAGISYLIVPDISEKQLSVRLFAIQTGKVKEITNIPLIGQLSSDRRQVHQVSDTLHHEMTGKPGIASTHILYTVKSKGGGREWLSDIWESDYDGANARQITRNREYCVTPSYIPPKTGGQPKQLIYVGYGSGQPRIFYASLQDGKGQRMTMAKGNQLTPALSHQRDKLAFICDLAGSPDLYVQSIDLEISQAGRLQRLFHQAGATESSPTFNPTGTEIAFTSDKDGSPKIYIIPTSGGKPKLISKRALNGSAPAWSPDGEKIAFSALTQGTRQIWIYDRKTDEEKQLTFSPGHKENPSWAPDSLHLVYNTANSNESELYLLNLTTLKPVKISSGPNEKRFPSWEVVSVQSPRRLGD